jgi:signal transduction histidine kinase
MITNKPTINNILGVYLTKARILSLIGLLILSWLAAWRLDLYSQKATSKESIKGKIDITSSMISSISTLIDSPPENIEKNIKTIDMILVGLELPFVETMLPNRDEITNNLQKFKLWIENPDEAKSKLLNTIAENLEGDKTVRIQIANDEKWLYDSKGDKLQKFKADSFKELQEPEEFGPNIPLILKGDAWQMSKIIPDKVNPQFYLKITQNYSPNGLAILQGKYFKPAFLIFTIMFFLSLISLYADWSKIESLQRYVRGLYDKKTIRKIPEIPKELEHRPELNNLALEIRNLRVRLELKEVLEEDTASMAHEMRKPVDAANSIAKLITAGGASLPVELRKDLEEIVDLSNEASELVKRILRLARLTVKPNLDNESACDINQIAEKVANIYKEDFDRGVILYTPSDRPAIVQGDKALIKSVIHNLLNNATIHGCRQGNNNRIEVTTLVKNKEVVIQIKDNGKGLSDYAESNIFFRIFTTKSESSEGDGHGLGLRFVKRIMELHDGKYNLCNHWGGAVATITFPSADVDDEAFEDVPTNNDLAADESAKVIVEEAPAQNPTCNISQITQSVIDELKEQTESSNIEIDYSPNHSTIVQGDAPLIKSAIHNLLSNAIHACLENQSFSIDKFVSKDNKNLIKIETHLRGSQMVLSIKDSGRGLTANPEQGQDLTFVRNVMDRHGGKLRTDNHANGGVVTIITFPITTLNDMNEQ